MGLATTVLIALGLALDAFAVALAVGANLGHVSPRQFFRLGWHFGLFQALMPMAGWLASQGAVRFVQLWGHWLVFGILATVGGKAVLGAVFGLEGDEPPAVSDPTRGFRLVALSLAVSVDALAVGLSFGVLGVSVWYPSAIIGIVALCLTVAGMWLGSHMRRRVEARWSRAIEMLSGLILIGLAVKVLLTHPG